MTGHHEYHIEEVIVHYELRICLNRREEGERGKENKGFEHVFIWRVEGGEGVKCLLEPIRLLNQRLY